MTEVHEPSYTYRATVERVIDGDTYHLRVDLGFHVAISVPVRLAGVDTPERGTVEGKVAKQLVEGLLLSFDGQPRPLLVRSWRDRRSFARWVCQVWFLSLDNQTYVDLGEHLVTEGVAIRSPG